MATNGHRTAYRTCPLCEATCGLEITLDGEQIVSIRGDARRRLQPRVRLPQGRRAQGAPRRPRPRPHAADPRRRAASREASWDEAFALIDERLSPILAADRNAVAVYLGNPNAHNLANMLYGTVLLRALATRNVLLGHHRRPVPQADRARR